MTTDLESAETNESGGALREKLEATNSENRQLREALAASAVINFKHVTAEDLKDVAPGDLQTRAAALEAERTEQRHQVLNEELKARGLTDEQIEKLAGPAPAAQSSPSPLEHIGNLGTPVVRPKPGAEDGLHGPSRIRAALGA